VPEHRFNWYTRGRPAVGSAIVCATALVAISFPLSAHAQTPSCPYVVNVTPSPNGPKPNGDTQRIQLHTAEPPEGERLLWKPFPGVAICSAEGTDSDGTVWGPITDPGAGSHTAVGAQIQFATITARDDVADCQTTTYRDGGPSLTVDSESATIVVSDVPATRGASWQVTAKPGFALQSVAVQINGSKDVFSTAASGQTPPNSYINRIEAVACPLDAGGDGNSGTTSTTTSSSTTTTTEPTTTTVATATTMTPSAVPTTSSTTTTVTPGATALPTTDAVIAHLQVTMEALGVPAAVAGALITILRVLRYLFG
jgi:cell division septation protein DedD